MCWIFWILRKSLFRVKSFLISLQKGVIFPQNKSWKRVIFYIPEHMCTYFYYESHCREAAQSDINKTDMNDNPPPPPHPPTIMF